ncbi:DUF1549 and DUF1553 domain-containing protein [Isosphaeraceae bacterium EP7]
MNDPDRRAISRTYLTQGAAGWLVVFSALLGLPAWQALGGEPSIGLRVAFTTDVSPLLTKFGCNSGGCHGKDTGQNGFKLSLLGYEPAEDYEAMVLEARGRRIFPASPEGSLILLKATGIVPHGGGRLITPDSEDYGVLRRWVEQGAPPPRHDDPVVQRVEIEPGDSVLSRNVRVSLRVRASLSDGSTRDVTRLALFESNEPDVAEVSASGEIQTKDRGGLFAVMVRYGDQFGVFHGTVPYHTPKSFASTSEAEQGGTWVDRLLRQQWRRLGIEPSPPADDATFLRRASLDICGTIPTPEEVRTYLVDARPDKRARLIDRLLERPEYASLFGLKWADILKNRGGGYSTSQQRAGTTLFAAWIREAVGSNMPYDRFASEILTAVGSQENNPPTVWYRSVRTSQDYVESISQAFLGVRVQCAQCHHHPAERWSQDDYYGLAAVFARVGRKGGFADAEVPTNQTIFVASEGRVKNPRTKRTMTPRPLGGPEFSVGPYDDPRASLAHWMTDPGNPFFARTMANRIWGHFFGRGLIHPIDDARSTNPPSHPELLDTLARDFARSGYDIKHLIRVCCNSEAYASSAEPNGTNGEDHQTFARFYPKRLQAEVLLDAFSDALGVATEFAGSPGKFPAGTRALDLPDETVPSTFLDVFGRPARSSACECERVDEASLGQALALIGSPILEQKLKAKDGLPTRMANDVRLVAEVVDDLFVRVLGRPARPGEVVKARRFLESGADRRDAFESLVWSLLVSAEFLFNH